MRNDEFWENAIWQRVSVSGMYMTFRACIHSMTLVTSTCEIIK